MYGENIKISSSLEFETLNKPFWEDSNIFKTYLLKEQSMRILGEREKVMMKGRQIWVKIKYIKHSKDGGYPTVIRWVLIMCKCQWRKRTRKREGAKAK